MQELNVSREIAIEEAADWIREDGWPAIGNLHFQAHPEEIPKWFNEGAPISPTPNQVVDT
jgi:hypothetical protein